MSDDQPDQQMTLIEQVMRCKFDLTSVELDVEPEMYLADPGNY